MSKQAANQKTHSEWSASGSSIWMNCPGQINLARTIPAHLRDTGNIHADRGTAAHGLLEICLTNDEDAVDYRNRVVTLDETGRAKIMPRSFKYSSTDNKQFLVDDDMIEAVQVALDYVRERAQELGKGTELRLEVRCYPLKKFKNMYGTSDVVLVNKRKRTIIVIDYKHGRVAVDAIGNTQLRYYGLGAMNTLDWAPEVVEMVIVQPRGQNSSEPVSREVLTGKKLKAWGKKLEAALEVSMSKKAPLIPGDHCRWCVCASANVCDAITKKAAAVMKMDFAEDAADAKHKKLRVPQTPDELAQVALYIPMIRAWIRATEKALVLQLANGHKVPGFKLVAGKANRRLRNDIPEEKLVKKLLKYFDEDEVFEKKIRGVVALEKALPAKNRKWFNKHFVIKPQGAPTYAPEDDPRPALEGCVKIDFKDMEDDE